MGTDSIPTRSNNTTIFAEHLNLLRDILIGDLVPRNASGVAEADAGSLGTDSLKFLKAFIESGYWSPGDIKPHYSYLGAVGSGQGWMKCDGRIINETNYDAEFSSGDWAKYVGTSPLDGKYLPNLATRFLKGTNLTTQNGSSPITPEGNNDSKIDLAHTHSVPGLQMTQYSSIQHQNYGYNSSGSLVIGADTTATADGIMMGFDIGTPAPNATGIPNQSLYTLGGTTGPASNAVSLQSIEPENIAVEFYMRVI